jgi:hypothetical protein
LRVEWLGNDNCLFLHQKFMDEEQHVSRCVGVLQHPCSVSSPLRPLLLLCLPHVHHGFRVKLSIDCLSTWNKFIITMNSHVVLQDPSSFNLQKSQKAQGTG